MRVYVNNALKFLIRFVKWINILFNFAKKILIKIIKNEHFNVKITNNTLLFHYLYLIKLISVLIYNVFTKLNKNY